MGVKISIQKKQNNVDANNEHNLTTVLENTYRQNQAGQILNLTSLMGSSEEKPIYFRAQIQALFIVQVDF
jgi:short-subunit dehydrogenase